MQCHTVQRGAQRYCRSNAAAAVPSSHPGATPALPRGVWSAPACRGRFPVFSRSFQKRVANAEPRNARASAIPNDAPNAPGFLVRRAAAGAAAALSAFLLNVAALVPPSDAVLVSPKATIPRSVDAALRRSVPAFNQARVMHS